MDITTTTPTITPEAKSETPPGVHPIKPLFFTNNGVLKRHAPPQPHGGAYKECLKNHAASMGGHALDGCGEFLHAPSASAADPTSLKCAACGCHRNFHRRDPDDPSPVIEYRPHHRHHPPPPVTAARGSQSPPPISSSYYPHMLLALSEPNRSSGPGSGNGNGNGNASRKRYRTKFTQEQKEKMLELAEKMGWKMQKVNDDLVKKCCGEIGVERGVFKVWMHNNKNTLVNRAGVGTGPGAGMARNGNGNGDGNSHSSSIEQQDHHHHNHNESNNVAANGSSSSS